MLFSNSYNFLKWVDNMCPAVLNTFSCFLSYHILNFKSRAVLKNSKTHFFFFPICMQYFQVVLEVKNPPANAGQSSWMGRSPGGGHGNPLQYSCLENPMDRGAWQTTVHGVPESEMTKVT